MSILNQLTNWQWSEKGEGWRATKFWNMCSISWLIRYNQLCLFLGTREILPSESPLHSPFKILRSRDLHISFFNSLKFIKRKQKKTLSRRWFGYRVLISINFCELLLWISPRIMNGLRSHIKNSKECFIRYPNISKSVKKTRLRLVFSTYFSGFGYPDETLFLVFHILHETFSLFIYMIIKNPPGWYRWG